MKQEKRDPRYPNSEDQTHTGHYSDIRDDWNIRVSKHTKKLSIAQQRVFDLLLTGSYTAREIAIKTGYFDPRNIIRRLKKKGIQVEERWYKRVKTGERFKRFTIIPDQPERTNDGDGPKSIRSIMDEHFKHLKRGNKDGRE